MEVRDLRDGDWLWTHKAVLFSRHLSPADFKVYCGLSAYAGNQDQRSWPSLITLGERLNLSKSTVIRSLRTLESCGAILIDRRVGMVSVYSLLRVTEIRQPSVPTKQNSPHHRLINFFHNSAIRFRSVKPAWSQKDVSRLKSAIATGIMSETKMEELMLYFLASPRFRQFSPSMSTFLSAGILNGLMNRMENDARFWKDLDGYSRQVRGTPAECDAGASAGVIEITKRLAAKMAIKQPA